MNPIGERSCYDEGKRTAETLTMDYHRQDGVEACTHLTWEENALPSHFYQDCGAAAGPDQSGWPNQ